MNEEPRFLLEILPAPPDLQCVCGDPATVNLTELLEPFNIMCADCGAILYALAVELVLGLGEAVSARRRSIGYLRARIERAPRMKARG